MNQQSIESFIQLVHELITTNQPPTTTLSCAHKISMVRDGVEVVILIPRTFWGEKAYSAFKETIGEKLSETNITAHTAVPELGIKTGDGHAWKLEFTANENSFNQLIKSLESKKRPDIGHSL